jgi:hypothetical protein
MLHTDCDDDIVESLVKGASNGISRAIVPKLTTHNEVMSAAFTFLDRTLRSIRKLQSPDERHRTCEQINKALQEMLVDHGHIPS